MELQALKREQANEDLKNRKAALADERKHKREEDLKAKEEEQKKEQQKADALLAEELDR